MELRAQTQAATCVNQAATWSAAKCEPNFWRGSGLLPSVANWHYLKPAEQAAE
jgi:hypothetical protein